MRWQTRRREREAAFCSTRQSGSISDRKIRSVTREHATPSWSVGIQMRWKKSSKEARHRLALYIQAMKGLSPLDKLNQGYSYVEKEGKAITSVQDVKEGDLLEICVSDGKITARAEKTSAVSWMEQS